MSAPTNTYSTSLELPLGNTPQVDELKDPELYKELTDIHDSIIAVASSLTSSMAPIDDFITKFRNVTNIDDTDSPYTILVTDGLIRVDASAGDVNLVLPTAVGFTGYEYKVKRIDNAPSIYVVNVDGTGGEQVDGLASGIDLDPKDAYVFKSFGTGYDLL